MEASLFESQQEQTRRTSFSFVQLKYYRIRERVTVCFTFGTCDERTNERMNKIHARYTCRLPLFDIPRGFKICRWNWNLLVVARDDKSKLNKNYDSVYVYCIEGWRILSSTFNSKNVTAKELFSMEQRLFCIKHYLISPVLKQM